MGKNFYKTSFSAILASMMMAPAFSQASYSCRSVMTTSEADRLKPYPTSLVSLPPEYYSLEKQISELNRELSNRKFRREMAEMELNGRTSIPLDKMPRELRNAQDALRKEHEEMERMERFLPMAKRDLKEAELYLASQKEKKDEKVEKVEKDDKKYSSLFYRPTVSYSEGDASRLRKEVENYENKIKNCKAKIEELKKTIEKLEAPVRAKGKQKAKETLTKLQREDAQDVRKIDELQEKKSNIVEHLRVQAGEALHQVMQDPRLRAPIQSILGFYTLRRLPKENKVTLLIGHELGEKAKIEFKLNQEVKELVTSLVEKKYYVVFDADSAYAPIISHMAGKYGVPVTAKEESRFAKHPNLVIINNDFIRMQALGDSKAVVISSDSISGIGLYSEGLATHVLDVNRSFETKALKNWVEDLDRKSRNLGITNKQIKPVATARELLDSSDYGRNSSLKVQVDDFKQIVQFNERILTLDAMNEVLRESVSYAKVMDENRNSGGSVIFGSSRVDPYSAELIYQSAYKLGSLGIAVATGGAGGAMEVANMGAYNAGGVSIGIPIGGKHTLANERNFASSLHTKTIMTSGYEERIPALLGDGADSRKMIIFAPGGNGTIKELATTLVRTAGKFEDVQKIIFLDAGYYKPLFDWLMQSQLPQAVKAKFVLLNSADEVQKLGQQMQEDFERARMKAPRKEKLTYFEPKKVEVPKNYGPSTDSSKKKSKDAKWSSLLDKPENKPGTQEPSPDSDAKPSKPSFKDPASEEDYFRRLFSDWYGQ